MNTHQQRTFLGHPLGLYVLFFTEMWERFSYYGMRALLILYMVNYFRWSQQEASEVYKVYTSFVYVTPILGGFLADRYLGNRLAVMIGAVLMAIGHFLMAFEEYPIFLSALGFLILGNGFFKPNMSTQVGRLYPPNDGRLDGAYTIFYMGINLGAFFSPILCGWLASHTVGGYHSGFTMAGIGMVIGLVIYLAGQGAIREIAADSTPVENPELPGETEPAERPLSEAEAEAAPSAVPALADSSPTWLTIGGVLLVLASVPAYLVDFMSIWNAIMLAMGGACLLLVGFVSKNVKGGLRDRVLAILALGVFVIFFWGAFEQAGNTLNLWADKATNRFLTREMVVDDGLIPMSAMEAAGEEGRVSQSVWSRFATMFKYKESDTKEATWADSFNPVSTESFQSINALGIFMLAPLFSWFWMWLDRRGMQPSIPMKMTIGLLFVSGAMFVMSIAGRFEAGLTELKYEEPLPSGIQLDEKGRVGFLKDGKAPRSFHAGRLTYDQSKGQLALRGVLPDTERDRIIEHAAPEDFRTNVVDVLMEKSQTINEQTPEVSVDVPNLPPGFDMKFSGVHESSVEYRDGKLIAREPLADKEEQGLLVAAADPRFRSAIQELYRSSAKYRVSPLWLVWSYLFATIGELCLSPVGLSMVSKLAPAKYATMLMGVWLLTSSFGNFVAGALGETWGTIPPIPFFLLSTVVVAGAAVVLFAINKKIVAAMHGVR